MILLKNIFLNPKVNEVLQINGWIRSIRKMKNVTFIMLNDGSCYKSLQVVLPKCQNDGLTYGSAISVKGALKCRDRVQNQDLGHKRGPQLELQAELVNLLGENNWKNYPIQKKPMSEDYLRSIPHLRLRTSTMAQTMRLRASILRELRRFLDERDFIETNPPLITSSDCEGAGETFQVIKKNIKRNGTTKQEDDLPSTIEFFNRPAHLTVSTQLHLEALALALNRVYTVTPAFRAEESKTSRHLAEFWMLELEQSFIDELDPLLHLAETLIKSVARQLLRTKHMYMESKEGYLTDRWQSLLNPWHRLCYDDAIHMMQRSSRCWNFEPKWGTDLQSEHEQWLTHEVGNKPLFVTDYPSAQKPFYMKDSTPKKSACFDLLFPEVGEVIGGSLRKDAKQELASAPKALEWYKDLRQYGSAPHGGFGLGIERLVSYLAREPNVRECIPFPRTAGMLLC
ncbi:asparagine-tRNA ligase Slm5 [Schizosaccharomyces japonicus yFS275]|uniref:asparagine--tRNA ligase n=1 Tax=Schizosaccharomyces japonicus (strain yFS275 / FY16936) TaxID=402676 RepID=B6K7Y3_SCHJY|nr:asparagine-tRNA ligase Slm5 [Schizosaccharomyces japonicus yFS275]EEB09637.1 asparagine-tRNA ligase Slm5 [Schizosaccharomyces japonicus yFS275]